MHEQSETIQRKDGKWVNVYGRYTGNSLKPLPLKYPWEKDAYDSVKQAEHAARKRSEAEGKMGVR